MSEENVEFARKVLGEFNAFMRDELSSEALAEAYDPEVEIYWHDRQTYPDAPQRLRGVQDLIAFTEEYRDGWADLTAEVLELTEAPDGRILVFVRSTARGRQSGVPIDLHFFAIYTIQDGEVRRVEYFRHRADALEAAGLSEWAMSQDVPPLETIRAGFDAFNRGDYESWIAVYDEDVEFLDLAETPDTGVFRGHAGARAWLAKLHEAWGEGFQFEPTSITEGDGVVVVDTRAKGVGTGSGVPIEMTVYTVMRYRDQKVVWTRAFIDRADALEAAGLRE